jgi:hypothetical protein
MLKGALVSLAIIASAASAFAQTTQQDCGIGLCTQPPATPASPPQSTADIVSGWGLLGTWALNCGQSPSRQNGYLSYVIKPGGRVSHEREFGDHRDANEVLKATVHADGSLELTVHFQTLTPQQTRRWSFEKGLDGRIRAVSNHRVDTNEYSIRDAKFTSNGASVPWQIRCR